MALYCSQKTIGFIKRNKQHNYFHFLDFTHSFVTENKLESHKTEKENKDFCNVNIPSDDTK